VPVDGDELLIRAGRNYHITPSDDFHAALVKVVEPSCIEYYPVHGKVEEQAPAEAETPEQEMMEEMDA